MSKPTEVEINRMKYIVCCPLCDKDKCCRGTDKCDAEIWTKQKVRDNKMNEFEEVKKIIKENYSRADSGLFFSRNTVGDEMINIYCKNGISIDICYYWAYFEVFGLNSVQESELAKFYEGLSRR